MTVAAGEWRRDSSIKAEGSAGHPVLAAIFVFLGKALVQPYITVFI